MDGTYPFLNNQKYELICNLKSAPLSIRELPNSQRYRPTIKNSALFGRLSVIPAKKSRKKYFHSGVQIRREQNLHKCEDFLEVEPGSGHQGHHLSRGGATVPTTCLFQGDYALLLNLETDRKTLDLLNLTSYILF